ncbi:MAG: hypothetical protein AAF329_27115 [Cyanobacteria bacterium P01_A01_bin.17]
MKEALQIGEVRTWRLPHKAVTDAWRPNEMHREKADMKEFKQWWKWADGEWRFNAATQKSGVRYVLTAGDNWISFKDLKEGT